MLLGIVILMSWLSGPISASETGSQPIPQVTPFNHPTLGPGLFFPEEAARLNDALTEAAIKKSELYERRVNDLLLLLEVTEAKVKVAQDSVETIPKLVSEAVKQGYRKGMVDGRFGIGLFGGYDFMDSDWCFGGGVTYRIWPR
jgi:hypothetical protein